MSLDAVPSGIDLAAVRTFLATRQGVTGVHDLHIWHMSTTEVALTAHLVMPGGHSGDRFLMGMGEELEEHYRIGHATIQVETDPQAGCALAPEHVV